MNEKFQEYLMSILEKTGEFLGEELPEVAEQILLFNLSISIFYLAVGVCLSCLSAYHIIKFSKIEGDSDEGEFVKMLLGGVICGLFGFVLIIFNISTVLKIWLAPKLYLLEYAAALVK